MNCKPDDLAVVVRNSIGDPCTQHMLGMPVTVSSVHHSEFGPFWLFKGRALRCPRCPDGAFIGFLDADLQPLRPGPEKADTSDSQDIRSGEVAHG